AHERQPYHVAKGSSTVCQTAQVVYGATRLVHNTKSNAAASPLHRKLPLPGYLADIFIEHREAQAAERAKSTRWEDWHDPDEPDGTVHDFVFTSARRPGRPLTPGGDAEQWGNILRRAGVRHAKPYTARHTAASRMIAAGIDLTVVAEILGHSDIKMLIEVYAHALEDRKRGASALLEAAWMTAPYSAPYTPNSELLGATQSYTPAGRNR